MKVVVCKECKFSGMPSSQTQRYGVKGALRCNNGKSACHARLVLDKDFCPYGEKKQMEAMRDENTDSV